MEQVEKTGDALETKVDNAVLFSRLKTLIRAISKVPDLEVVDSLSAEEKAYFERSGKSPKEAWFFDPKSRKVHIPSEMTEIPQIEALGKASHEAAHVAITRITEVASENFLRHLGMSSLALAVEERPTDEYVRKYTPGAGEWLDAARSGSLAASLKSNPSNPGAHRSIPKFLQLSNLIVYGRFDEKLRTSVDNDVWQIYSELKQAVTKIENTLPSEDASENEVVEIARQRFAQMCTDIVPHINSLVEKDIKKEQEANLIRDKDLVQQLLQQLTEDLQKELKKATEETDRELSNTPAEKPPELPATEPEEVKEPGDPEEQPTDSSKPPDASGELEDESGTAPSTANPPIPTALSPELQQKIKEFIESLPKDTQRLLRELAEKKLRDAEDKQVQELKGKISDADDKTPAKQKKEPTLVPDSETTESMDEPSAREETKILSDSDKTQLRSYEKTFQEVTEYTDSLFRKLDEIFHPNIKRGMQLRSAGSKINLPAIFRHTSQRQSGAQNIDNKIFEVTKFPEPKDYAVTVLVDLSGSMRNDGKIEAAYGGSIMLAEALSRTGIKVELLGFQDTIIVFKDFDTPFSDVIRARMPGIVDEVNGEHKGGNNMPSFNDDGPCLREASERIAKTDSKSKILVVISDGVPEGRRSRARDLTSTIEHIKTNTDQHLAALGLGDGTEHVKSYYGKNGRANVPISKISEELGDLLYNLIENPEAFK